MGGQRLRCLHLASSLLPARQGNPIYDEFPALPSPAGWRAYLLALSTPPHPGPRPDLLLPVAPQITRASTTGQGATTTSSRKDPRPRRLRRQWTCPSCRPLGRPGRLWAAWSTRCRATTRRARRNGSPTSWRIPPGTRLARSPACPGLSTPCLLRSSGPVRPSHRCRSTAGQAMGTTCLTPPK